MRKSPVDERPWLERLLDAVARAVRSSNSPVVILFVLAATAFTFYLGLTINIFPDASGHLRAATDLEPDEIALALAVFGLGMAGVAIKCALARSRSRGNRPPS